MITWAYRPSSRKRIRRRDAMKFFALIAAIFVPSPLRQLWESRAVAHDFWLEAGGCQRCSGTGKFRGRNCKKCKKAAAGLDPLLTYDDIYASRVGFYPLQDGIGAVTQIW